MRGWITELHFESAESLFPGIRRFYSDLPRKPLTFLELVWEYERHAGRCSLDEGEPLRIADRQLR
jgi:hypothetical protein